MSSLKIQVFNKSKTISNPACRGRQMRTKNWCHANNFSIWGAREYGDLQRENGEIGVFVEDKDFNNPETAMLNPLTTSRLNVLELWAGQCGLVHLKAPLTDFSLLSRLNF